MLRPRALTEPARRGLTIARQRRFWTRRAAAWEHTADSTPGLGKVIETVIDVADPAPGDTIVDLGCGSGQLSIPLAQRGASVVAVDVSPAMTEMLESNAAEAEVEGVEPVTAPIEDLDLRPGSADAVVSNYALHHLRDEDKAAVVEQAARWLRPGGRLVIGDMMFGRGGDARDRQIIFAKVSALARRGPGGWWRIAKNAARYLTRTQERPVSIKAWTKMLERAGFRQVEARSVVSEAAVVSGVRPPGEVTRS
ncbi:MAG TPA: methyltransferase domain-containing protein [Acidimicrobiales bacterium]|nr:methyltransferase domain-containing protein [Acidimicrobiales bacterium]